MRKLLWATFGVVLISMVFAGCKKEEEPTYMVQATATEGGTVEGQSGEYKEGETVVFTAVPADGYYFSKWSDGNTNNPRTITIRKDLTITAEFAQNLLLTISASDNGTIETDVNGRYSPGSSVTVTAKPDADYFFASWSDGSTDNPRTITIDKEITITAQFAQNPLVTIIAGSNGSVNGSTNGRYVPGSRVTITVTPDADYYFTSWSDGNTDNPRTIIVGKEDINLTANFFVSIMDLGLESGVLWTTRNLGAIAPWDYGYYYAWGETETKDDYGEETYKYFEGTSFTITKYCNDAEYGYNGFTDALTTLEAADDAATTVIGPDYSMPTNADWKELSNQCYWVWTENYNNQNVNGYIVYKAKSADDKGTKVYRGDAPAAYYSLSDPHIFLPAAGYRYNSYHIDIGHNGDYWSVSLYEEDPNRAYWCVFSAGGVYPSNNEWRICGQSVRPVSRK